MTETSSTSTHGNPHGAPGGAPGGAAFFDWVRGLGFVRGQDRWLAGVCGAIAARTGLDPLIVRGIAVVVAILGGPIFFLYAVGWALIPDQSSGRSLVEQAVRQVFEPAMIVVGVLLFFTFIPWMQGIWWQGPPEIWGMPGWLEVLLRTSWAIGLTIGLILLVVYIAKRVPSQRTAAAPKPTEPAAQPDAASSPNPADPTPTATFVPPIPPVPAPPAGPSLWDDWTGTSSTASTTPDATAPSGTAPYGSAPYATSPYGTAPSGTAPSGTAPYGSTPNTAGSRPAAPAAAFDPDRYRSSHRRRQLGAGFVSVVSGLALTAGALAAAIVADGNWTNSAFLVGAAAALAVVALGIIVAGIRGKEGGWLNGFSIVLASTMFWTAFVPAGSEFMAFGDPTWEYTTSDPTGYAMIAGAPTVDLTSVDSTPSATNRTVDVWLAFGDVELVLPENRTVVVEASNLAGGIDYDTPEGAARDSGVLVHDSRVVIEGAGTGITTVRVWNGFGEVTINQPAEPALR